MELKGSFDNPGFQGSADVIYVGSSGILKIGGEIRYFDYVSQNKIKENYSPQGYVLTGSGIYSSMIFETCHGVNYDQTSIFSKIGKTGKYNFYHAPYGASYYHPPFGELPTIAEENYGISYPTKKQADDLNISDKLKIFGLRLTSDFKNFDRCKTYSLQGIHEGISDCPIQSKPAVKYAELSPELSAGSYSGLIGGNIYNHNPFPCSYDRGVLVVNSAYSLEKRQDKCVYSTGENGTPIPVIARNSTQLSKNYSICSNLDSIDRGIGAGAVDAHTEAMGMNDPNQPITPGMEGKDVSNYDTSTYWHFIFKNNHEVLPFGNTHETSQGMSLDNDLTRENHWWEHRECPENIDYLNHAYGNNLNACPSNYLDVPYYASIGKFGYFGSRFQDTWRFISNEGTGVEVGDSDRFRDYPEDPDEEYYSRALNIGGSSYNALLKEAAAEIENYSWFSTDYTLFLKLNKDIIKTTSEYNYLVNKVVGFQDKFESFCDNAANGNNFTVGEQSKLTNTFSISNINRGPDNNWYSNNPVETFRIDNRITGLVEVNEFNNLIKNYASFKIKDINKNIDTDWYDNVVNQKRKRIAERYYKNIASGKPVDLFPNGEITFSSEEFKNFADSDHIKYATLKASSSRDVPITKRTYFSTSLSSSNEASGIQGINKTLEGVTFPTFDYNKSLTASVGNFYIGHINRKKCGNDIYIPDQTNHFLELINLPKGGHWDRFAPETDPPNINPSTNPQRTGWPSAGYGRIGRVNSNYSCFSPLFLQQPRNESVKLRQPPKFRVYALDYHSIPEEKINENAQATVAAYPEIDYWLRKTKTINPQNGKNLYPLKYKWYRVLNSNAQTYYRTKSSNLIEASSTVGNWCCAEGDGPDCTVIRPGECKNLYGGSVVSNGTVSISEENCSIFMGPNSSDANNYLYFCRVEGRFGWRDSEFARIIQDNTVTVQAAVYSPAGTIAANLDIAGVQFSLAGNGVIGDPTIVSEEVQEETWNASNNCTTTRFVGPEAVRGVTRVYTPRTFVDPRGKVVRKAHYQEFGQIASSKKTISDAQAVELYCKRALPYCDMNLVDIFGNGYKYDGVPIKFDGLIHRTRLVKAILSTDSSFGVRWNKIRNVAELYPPIRYQPDGGAVGFCATLGRNPGHAQFQENLGCIKIYSRDPAQNGPASSDGSSVLFGKNSRVDGAKAADRVDIVGLQIRLLNNNSNQPIKSTTITGPECGYVNPSAGRLMHFYVETFDTYYSLCEIGGIKPKKVQNESHIAGGLRTGRPGLQYNFLGKPNNARLKWTSMPGAYAFQWKVERHNRDRNGNGMPLCFWSYNWEERMDNMYDAAAVYGAVRRIRPSPRRQDLKSKRLAAGYGRAIGGTIGPDDGPKYGCGGTRWKIDRSDPDPNNHIFKPNKEIAEYIEAALSVSPDFSAFGCPPNDKNCFPACVSLKYPEGYSPKGAKTMFSPQYLYTSNPYSSEKYSIRVNNKTVNIKHVKMTPCEDNSAQDNRDLCNYLTPTLHIGIDTFPVGSIKNLISQRLISA